MKSHNRLTHNTFRYLLYTISLLTIITISYDNNIVSKSLLMIYNYSIYKG